MILSRNFISHHIQQYSNTSTNCTYLSLIPTGSLFIIPNLIHLLLGISSLLVYYWNALSRHLFCHLYYHPTFFPFHYCQYWILAMYYSFIFFLWYWNITFFDFILMKIRSFFIASKLRADNWIILQINFC